MHQNQNQYCGNEVKDESTPAECVAEVQILKFLPWWMYKRGLWRV